MNPRLEGMIQNKLREPFIQWTAVIFGFAVWGISLTLWVTRYKPLELRTQLMHVSPLFLWAGGLAFLYALWLNRAALSVEIQKQGTRRRWLALASVCLLAWVLVRGVAPRTHRLFYDEDIYQAIALNIAQNNEASMNNDGRWEYGHFVSYSKEFNKQPNGWPFVISLAYRIFGVSENVAFNVSNLLFLIAIFAIFMAGMWFFNDFWAALCSAGVYAMIPVNVQWFSTIDGDPPTACFTILAMVATLYFFRRRTLSALFLSASAWAWVCQFRFEVILLGLLVFVMVCMENKEELKKPRLYAALLVFLTLLMGHFVHLYAVHNESWGSNGEKLASAYFWHNLKTNTEYFFNGKTFPVIFSLLALAGLCGSRRWRPQMYAALWFVLSWAVFLFFYAGSYTYGVDVRYAILSMPPIALLAGWGASRLMAAGQRWLRTPTLVWGMALALSVTLLLYLPKIRSFGAESWQCRADHIVAKEFSELVPEDGIILTQNPNMFQIWGKNAAQMSLFTSKNPYGAQMIKPRFGDRIYMHWNYWCNTQDPVQQNFCKNVLASYDMQLVAERTIDHQRFALYRILNDHPDASRKKPL